jgi:hypothetical protein
MSCSAKCLNLDHMLSVMVYGVYTFKDVCHGPPQIRPDVKVKNIFFSVIDTAREQARARNPY